MLDEWTQTKAHNDFYTTYEDYWDILLKYYGIPSLSMRNALHALVQSDEPGFRRDELWGDNLHPSATGHALLGYMILDNMKLVTRLARQLGDRLADYVSDSMLPPPMFPENHHHKGMCGQGNAFKDQVVYKDFGWEWDIELHEGRDSKEGYMADGVFGHRLRIRVPPESVTHLHTKNYTAHLGVVKSWKPFGTIAVRCVEGGCVCDASVVDLHDKTAQTTMQILTDFTLAAGAVDAECLIEVEVIEKTSSTGRYVKVMSFAVEVEPGSSAESL